MQKTLIIRHLGLRDYQQVFDAMRDFTAKRDANTCDEVWLLQHPHVFTQGKAGKAEHVLNPGEVPIIQTDRGGQVTYHGPGQLIIYPLFDIRRLKFGVKNFVATLEQVIVDMLSAYNITAQASDAAPGIYTKANNTKICSLGLRIHRGCSYHGLALNVTTDLSYFNRINPCGFKNLQLVNMADLVKPTPSMEEITNKITALIQQKFRYTSATTANDLPNAETILTTNRKPPWIRSKLTAAHNATNIASSKIEHLLRTNTLATVCEEAACPNRTECFGRGTATFMILGDTCTRNCSFCNVKHGRPDFVDPKEALRLAETIAAMHLQYVVITSVCRDDLADEGALHFANCIAAIRKKNPRIKIEILTPDFRKNIPQALTILKQAPPDVFGHNIETAPRLYRSITPIRNYQLSLQLLQEHKKHFPKIPTKSGLMVGLGETNDEIEQVLKDLRQHEVDRITIGQYLQPSAQNAPVARYVTPEEFVYFAKLARDLGFTHIASAPMVRSSYYADKNPMDN